MSKHTHHQSKTEQSDNQVKINIAENDSSTKLRAYQIHLEKGGSDLDNWLEAEQFLRNPTNSLATSNRDGSGGGG
jgi:hypothetical protein